MDPGVDAVEFADEAEALLCLTRDIAGGVAGRKWWWAQRLPRHGGSRGDLLAAAWVNGARWVPSVLATLAAEDPSAAVRLVSLMPAAAQQATLAAVHVRTRAFIGSEPVPAGDYEANENDRAGDVLESALASADTSGLAAPVEPLVVSGSTAAALLEASQDANLLVVARAVVSSALARQESRGGHFRTDFPEADPEQARHSAIVSR